MFDDRRRVSNPGGGHRTVSPCRSDEPKAYSDVAQTHFMSDDAALIDLLGANSLRTREAIRKTYVVDKQSRIESGKLMSLISKPD